MAFLKGVKMADSQRPYRGRRLDTNEWVYGYLRRTPRIAAEIYSRDLGGTFEVHLDTVSQYLRKDKNGEDIYSNMPIRYCDKDYPKGFVWDESGLRWTINDGFFHTHYGKTGTGGEDDYLDLEVIGTIHDKETQ